MCPPSGVELGETGQTDQYNATHADGEMDDYDKGGELFACPEATNTEWFSNRKLWCGCGSSSSDSIGSGRSIVGATAEYHAQEAEGGK